MFHQHILTFIQVAEHKSFSAAAKALFLTPNAVKKRIESLERETGLLLFYRTNQGCALTKAGASLYRDLLEIEKQYTVAIANATYAQAHSSDVLFIGLMSTFEESFMTNTWHNIRQKLRTRQIQTVHYGPSLSHMDEMLKKIGTATMLCVDIYDKGLAEKYRLSVKKISSFPLYIGMPYNPERSVEQPLPLEALSGQWVTLPPKGRAKVFDDVRQQLLEKVPCIRITDLEEYTVRSMNDCFMKQQMVLVAENQTAHYPFYTFVPLDIPQKIDFGVYYKKRDEKTLNGFLKMIAGES